eukprot:5763891-Heterocapsa_arctica.AAC.1
MALREAVLHDRSVCSTQHRPVRPISGHMNYENPAFLRMLLGMGAQIAIAAKQAAQEPPARLAQAMPPQAAPAGEAPPLETSVGTAALLRATPKYSIA